jgi:hypothetical protein
MPATFNQVKASNRSNIDIVAAMQGIDGWNKAYLVADMYCRDKSVPTTLTNDATPRQKNRK